MYKTITQITSNLKKSILFLFMKIVSETNIMKLHETELVQRTLFFTNSFDRQPVVHL